jgi:hypothetical protein
MSYNLYTLDVDEQAQVRKLNEAGRNVLMIIMEMDGNVGVSADDIQDDLYKPYLDAIGGVYNPLKVVVI